MTDKAPATEAGLREAALYVIVAADEMPENEPESLREPLRHLRLAFNGSDIALAQLAEARALEAEPPALDYADGFEAGRQSAAANIRALVKEATKPNGDRRDAYWLDEAVRAIFDLDGAAEYARLTREEAP
jgi:hypothetical protein